MVFPAIHGHSLMTPAGMPKIAVRYRCSGSGGRLSSQAAPPKTGSAAQRANCACAVSRRARAVGTRNWSGKNGDVWWFFVGFYKPKWWVMVCWWDLSIMLMSDMWWCSSNSQLLIRMGNVMITGNISLQHQYWKKCVCDYSYWNPNIFERTHFTADNHGHNGCNSTIYIYIYVKISSCIYTYIYIYIYISSSSSPSCNLTIISHI